MEVICLSVLLVAGPALAQESDEREREPANEIGVFVGALSNLDAEKTGASLGVDYTRELSASLGVGVLAELARAGEREALVAASLVFRPAGGLKLVLAPGVLVEKLEEEHGEREEEPATSLEAKFVVRLGVGYAFDWKRITLTPSIYFDFLESSDGGTTAHIVYGLSIGFPF